jgi:S1-C subfamily serine protease
VVEVVSGSPADNSGLRGSDRRATTLAQSIRFGGDFTTTTIDGQPFRCVQNLQVIVGKY